MKMFKLHKRVEKEGTYWKSEDIEFHPRFAKGMLKIAKAGYFNNKPMLSCTITTLLGAVALIFSPFIGWWFAIASLIVMLCVPWGELYLRLPYRTNLKTANPPEWGFYFYGVGDALPETFVICFGKKIKSFDLPWTYVWIRTSKFTKDGYWLHETRADRRRGIAVEWWKEEIDGTIWKKTYDYTYVLKSGEKQRRRATVSVEEREWRQRWLVWIPIFSKVVTTIDVDFNEAIGEGVGSWKGGVYGCSWEMLPGETPLKALRRMEKVRKWNC